MFNTTCGKVTTGAVGIIGLSHPSFGRGAGVGTGLFGFVGVGVGVGFGLGLSGLGIGLGVGTGFGFGSLGSEGGSCGGGTGLPTMVGGTGAFLLAFRVLQPSTENTETDSRNNSSFLIFNSPATTVNNNNNNNRCQLIGQLRLESNREVMINNGSTHAPPCKTLAIC